jgi:HD-like signal output (HDOD) protein
MKRILFVDDEPRVLDGLRRTLYRHRDRWETAFTAGATDAIDACERQPFDVVVSDMRMPEIDGATLLGIVAARWPTTVRVVLSGQTDMMAALRASRIAHQFLSKPCNATALESVLERACGLRDLVTDARIEAIVGGLESLPAVPSIYHQLTSVLAQTDASITDVADVVRRDPALSAKILQLVNSSFFGQAHEVTSIDRGVSLLGTRLIQSLAMIHGVFNAFERQVLPLGFDPRAEQTHATRVAGLARRFAPDRARGESAFTAALLHDLGRLLLAIRAPDAYSAIWERAVAERVPLVAAEIALLGVSHADLGAYLLGVWGLPWGIIDAVRHHHAPAPDPDGTAMLVHVADALVHELAPPGDQHPPASPLAGDAIAAAGFDDRLAGWREQAAALVAEGVA